MLLDVGGLSQKYSRKDIIKRRMFMRKVLKAAVCLGLSLTLGFSTVAFGAEKKEDVKSKFDVQVQKKAEKVLASVKTKSRQAKAANYSTSGKAKVCYTEKDIENAPVYQTSQKAGVITRFTLTMPVKGKLAIGVLLGDINDNTTTGNATLRNASGKSWYISTNSRSATTISGLPRGTYYLDIQTSVDGTAYIIPACLNSETTSLTGSYRMFAGNGGNVYKTFSVSKRSQVWVDSYSTYSYLQKKSGKKWTTVSDKKYSSTSNVRKYYALSKGSYRVVFPNTYASGEYIARYGKKAYTGKYGTKKSKAKTIKRKKSKTNVLTASDAKKKTHWYKFKVTKRRSTQFKITTYNSSGSVTATLYKGKKKMSSRTAYNPSYITFSGKLSKGTYYVKVTKNTKKTSTKYIVKYVK